MTENVFRVPTWFILELQRSTQRKIACSLSQKQVKCLTWRQRANFDETRGLDMVLGALVDWNSTFALARYGIACDSQEWIVEATQRVRMLASMFCMKFAKTTTAHSGANPKITNFTLFLMG